MTHVSPTTAHDAGALLRRVPCAALIMLVLASVAFTASAKTQVPRSAEQIRLSYAPVVAKAAPAVVNIYATTVRERVSPFADDPFFSEFFRDFAGPPRVQNSLGSGVLVGGGLVVTNFHVIGQASRIRVVLADRREYAAEVALADKAAENRFFRHHIGAGAHGARWRPPFSPQLFHPDGRTDQPATP